MTQLRHVLLWSVFINYAVLLFWWLLFSSAHEWFYRLQRRWYALSTETFDALNWGGIAGYKLIIIFFNLVPLIAVYTAPPG